MSTAAMSSTAATATAGESSDEPQQSDLSSTSSITLEPYSGEHQMPSLISLIESELSEPYIVYTYRYFVNQWPNLCFLAYTPRATPPSQREAVGVIVCKLDRHLKGSRLMRGYIAMISVRSDWRGRGLAKRLVCEALREMVARGAQEVVLETEADNEAALGLYERLGFIREKRLHRFYLNGKDSFRLVLPIPPQKQQPIPPEAEAPPLLGLVQPPIPPPSQPDSIGAQDLAFTLAPTTQIANHNRIS